MEGKKQNYLESDIIKKERSSFDEPTDEPRRISSALAVINEDISLTNARKKKRKKSKYHKNNSMKLMKTIEIIGELRGRRNAAV